MTAIKTARVLITTRCNRDCSYCVNKQPGILDGLVQVPFWFEKNYFEDFEAICISGGEPMLYPEMVSTLADRLKQHAVYSRPVYLYTAQYTNKTEGVLKHVDGVNFTLHENPSPRDIMDFHRFQELIAKEENISKSFRLLIDPKIDQPLSIIPSLWKRVEIVPWLKECPLPENETLFKWGEY